MMILIGIIYIIGCCVAYLSLDRMLWIPSDNKDLAVVASLLSWGIFPVMYLVLLMIKFYRG